MSDRWSMGTRGRAYLAGGPNFPPYKPHWLPIAASCRDGLLLPVARGTATQRSSPTAQQPAPTPAAAARSTHAPEPAVTPAPSGPDRRHRANNRLESCNTGKLAALGLF